MSMLDMYQVNYQTVDHISTPALTQFWGAIDAANQAGYVISHSNDPHTLMIDPSHLYDVAEALGFAIKTPPETMVAEFKRLTWPRFIGSRKFRTSIWPSGKSVNCWTFDVNKSESNMTHQTLDAAHTVLVNIDQAIEQLDDVQSLIGIWRDTLQSLDPNAHVSLSAGDLVKALTVYYDRINAAKTLL